MDTDLSRNLRLKYWSSTGYARLSKRVQARQGLPVRDAMTPSGSSPLNALARLILSPNPSEPHTLKNAEHCQKRLPVGMVFEWLIWAYPAFVGLIAIFHKQ